MPWTLVDGCEGNTFRGRTAEDYNFILSAMLLTLRGAGQDGYHYLVDSAGSSVHLRYVSNEQEAPLASGIQIGDACAWSTNLTDPNASTTSLNSSGRGRNIVSGTVTGISDDRRTVQIAKDNTTHDFPEVGEIIYFNA